MIIDTLLVLEFTPDTVRILLCPCVKSNTDMAVSSLGNDPRRFTALKTLRDIGRAEANTHVGMLAVLSTYPTYNPHTAYSVTMDALTGEFHVFVRVPMCPETRGAAPMWDSRYCQGIAMEGGARFPHGRAVLLLISNR